MTPGPGVGRPPLALLALLVASATLRAGPLPDEDDARRRGPSALPEILPLAEAEDPDVRLRARRLARRITLDFLRDRSPEGMRLVPPVIAVTGTGVRCEGGFYLAVHEVTLGEFRAFAAKAGLDDARWREGAATHPVTSVSLEEARAYAAARDARLPTADELQRAGRGGGFFRYPWGDRFDAFRVNGREAGRGAAEPVGTLRGGLSVHGIADLLGNAAEWTETPGERGPGVRYLIVGGSWRVPLELGVRETYQLPANQRLPDVGFRLAKSLPPVPPPGTGE